ncbi:hypothetical protein [Companilactobacillus zhachilii]|uniref:hypothetical protein n=1 Tax=Companilactobacillus zhachilii TaxID=2304606 RepID=UPI00142329DC|nr:hypothetical protein [Companilactobacillus zhachilii]
MSILQQFNQTVHHLFVHLSNILRSVSIKKTRGVKIVTLLDRTTLTDNTITGM